VRSWKRWLYLVSGLAVLLVAVASAAQAIRQGSWAPLVSVAWLPAVIGGCWPGTGRCLPWRRTPAGWPLAGDEERR
jgi:peptidoglycan/LPS O-acetylase OafA/YrhL